MESVFTEKGTGGPRFKRSYGEKLRGKKALIVDDVINTGGTVYELVTAVMAEGAIILGIGAFWNRGRETAESLNVPVLRCLVEEVFPCFSPEECPACKDGKPLNTDFGHGGR